MPNLQKAYDKYAPGGDFVVLGISLDSAQEPVAKFVAERKVPWAQVVAGPAEQNPIAQQYNVSGVPATFLVGRDGKVVARDVSGWRLHAELGKLLPDAQPQAQASR